MTEYNLKEPYDTMELNRQTVKNIVFYNPILTIILSAIGLKIPFPVTDDHKKQVFEYSRAFVAKILNHYDDLSKKIEMILYEEGEREKLYSLYESIIPKLVGEVLDTNYRPMELKYRGTHKPSDTCMWKSVDSFSELPRADGNITGNPYLPPSDEDMRSFEGIVLKSVENKYERVKYETIEPGTPLFHSTTVVFQKPGQYTNWFSRNEEQTRLHVIDEIANRANSTPVYLYNYEYTNYAPLRLIRVDNLDEWNDLTAYFNLNLEPGTADDYLLAGSLCKLAEIIGGFDGWYFPFDQDQVMLCHPALEKLNLTSLSYFHRTYYSSKPLPHSPLEEVHPKFLGVESMDDIEGLIKYNSKYFGCYLIKNSKKSSEGTSKSHEKSEKEDRINVYWDTDTYIYSTFRRTIDSLVDSGVLDRKTVDKNFNTFVTAMVTNSLRPYIYGSINVLGQIMESDGIFVISGGEAINHLLPQEYRNLTPDIDTKFVPVNLTDNSFDNYVKTMTTRNKMWYQGMEAVIRLLEENYYFIYKNNLLPLEQTSAFKAMGVKFLHPDIVKNPRYNPEGVIFVKRQVIARKEDHYDYSKFKNIGVGRLFDVYIYSIDMRIQSSYEYSMEQYLSKCDVRYHRDYLVNEDLAYLNSILQEIGSVREQVDTVEEARAIIHSFYEQCSYGFLMDLSGDLVRQDPSTIAGILDCPFMRPGELGFDIIEECNISYSEYTDKKLHKFLNYTASYKYIDHDIDIMIDLGLRAGKATKDKRRQSLLRKLNEKGLIRKPFSTFTGTLLDYKKSGPWVECELMKSDVSIDELYKYTLFDESSISKTLSNCAPPILKGYLDQNGLIDFDELVGRISTLTGDSPTSIRSSIEMYVSTPTASKFDYEGKKWNPMGDMLTNCFTFRFASYELSSVRNTGKIILDMLTEIVSSVIPMDTKPQPSNIMVLFNILMKMQYSMPYMTDPTGVKRCLLSSSFEDFSKIIYENVARMQINGIDLLYNIVYDVLAQCYHLYEPYNETYVSVKRTLLEHINNLGQVSLKYEGVRPILLGTCTTHAPIA